MDDPLEKARHRAYRYWYSDGFAEMISGCVFLLVSMFNVIDIVQKNSPWRYPLLLILFLGLLGYAFFSRKIITSLKQQHTYPRTGYVSYQHPPRKRRWLWVGLSIAVMTCVQILQQAFSLTKAGNTLGVGIVIGLLFIYLGYRIDLKRYYAAGILSIVLGLLLSLLSDNGALIFSVYYGSLGIWLIGSGAITRAHYLRNAPAPEEEELETTP